jgi:hypothetical protein
MRLDLAHPAALRSDQPADWHGLPRRFRWHVSLHIDRRNLGPQNAKADQHLCVRLPVRLRQRPARHYGRQDILSRWLCGKCLVHRRVCPGLRLDNARPNGTRAYPVSSGFYVAERR